MNLKMRLLAIVILSTLVSSISSAQENRCYVHAGARWFISIYAGTSFHESRQVTEHTGYNLDSTLQDLANFQEAGVCPMASDPNDAICAIYSTTAYDYVVGIIINNRSYDLTTGANSKESLEIAKKLVQAGQCKKIQAGK
jgi:hypothetical protein